MHYRQIYEKYHQCSLLPGIEIHHIDKNSANNDPSNLMAVTIEEHLEIHLMQEDWGAVQAILMRMENKNAEIANAASKKQKQLVEKGVHNFQKMSKERRREISQKAGIITRDNKIGLHRINQDPVLSRENATKGGKASQIKRQLPEYAYLNTLQGKAVAGTKWFRNVITGKRVRSNVRPDGDEWIAGTGPQSITKPKNAVKNTGWWINVDTNERKRSSTKPNGHNWKKGFNKNDNDK